ncbi:Leucine-rich repeat-containing protein SOG2 [Mycena indigotica]|uniref:Leucine-rich repeat-containing protein SOG2 n=1 Tax=Mycena indigotica TaxID=2126181 RepID=A0A8H6VYD1_9AGAR|nr:Leucine-rich repeat-containing protein SOG2 [Mycena indigotica]KAF7294768.1 Leucine-rich repeat-containing protein SOG2 [Mycena indigotica]
MSDRWLCQLLRDSLPDHFAQCAELAKDFESALSSFEAGQSIDLDPLITSVHRHLASTPSFGWRQLHTDACMLAALSSPPLTAIAKLDTAIIVSGAADRLDIVLDLIERIQSDNLLREPFKGSSYVFPLPEVEPLTAPTIPLLEALPSFTAFQSNKHQYPFVVRNYASHWPALNEHPWASTEYLISAAGRGRVVPVEVGRDYRTDDWSQKLVEWDTFLALLDDSTAEPLYLAQHSLLMQFPSLRADIQVPDYVYATLPRPSGCEPPGNDDQLVINAWFGPRDTVSPAHTDPYYNMYVQVVGRKRVWLAPSNCERGMYADGNTSAVDVFSPDRKKHPDFEDFVAGQGMTALLDPGDLLYIPAKWWHAMRSEAARSFSISMLLLDLEASTDFVTSVTGTLSHAMPVVDSFLPPSQPLSKPPPSTMSPASQALTPEHIADALAQSNDGGATLVFLKKNLTNIGEEAAEELATLGRETPEDESLVERMALGHNRLTTLPTAFALLSRLRYLNLKNNLFTVFPDVLTLLPALDTLDISHNKIKRLPTQPGKLLNLRVFCLARNKLTRLPIYISKFYKLEVLQLERNPIDWPPKSVVTQPESPQAMRDWIRSVQKWIEAETSRPRIHDDSGFSEQELENNIEDSYNSWSNFTPVTDKEFDGGLTPHARSFSIDSTFSASSLAESESAQEDTRPSFDDRPPPLHLGMLGSFSPQTSPTHSFESYLPSPADSDKFFDEPVHPPRTDSLRNANPDPTAHARNASYASGIRARDRGPTLGGKKSMPDLRTAKLSFLKKMPELPNKHNHEDSFPSPQSLRKDSDSSGSSSAAVRSFTKDSIQVSPTRTAPAPSMAFERNSYFRRVSKLPASTIFSTLPESLISLMDSARSILFAMCQVYQSLEHYTIHAPDDRLKTVLRKVLDPASTDMMQFINALDKFDAMSRKMQPSHTICRGVVESCRDTVASFGKAVGVLSLQLKVIAGSDDVRYLRSMLLMLYGATAEVANAWQSMQPQIETIRPLLHPKAFPISSPLNGSPDAHPSQYLGTSDQSPPPVLRSQNGLGTGRTRMARRHAGSFSFKDIEIGKQLPSYDEPPPMIGGVVAGVATQTPTLRANKRHLPAPFAGTITVSSASPQEGSSRGNQQSHSRNGSQASLYASSSSASASSSPSIPSKAPYLELPTSSKTQVDKEALQAIQSAVEVAPTVWDMIEETLGDALDAEVRESLERARTVTRRLAEITRVMQDGTELPVDRKVLREDSNLFLKTVVHLSNVIKQYGGAHSATLRSNLVKLTNSTEEFAILLHVSSFSPLPTNTSTSGNGRSYSPMPGSPAPSMISAVSPVHPPEEYRVGSSLSRSRSAQPSASSKLAQPSQDPPRSALPSQTFNFKAMPPALKRGRLAVGEAG